MGKSKDLFMQDREEESFASQLLSDDAASYQADLRAGFTALSNRFDYDIDQYENGHISAIDLAVKFKNEIETMEAQVKNRKEWLDEAKREIANEAEGYGKEGYKGLVFSVQTRTTYNFSKVQEVAKLKADIKELEEKGKLALKLIEKGIEPLDVNTGELLPVPEVTVTSFLKTDKAK